MTFITTLTYYNRYFEIIFLKAL